MKVARDSIIYVAGPMTGKPNHNHPAFHEMAKYLRAQKLQVRNPAEINPLNPAGEQVGTYAEVMARDIDALLCCHAVVFLDGWEASRGALLEFAVATTLGLPCFSQDFRQIKRTLHMSTAPVVIFAQNASLAPTEGETVHAFLARDERRGRGLNGPDPLPNTLLDQ